MDLHLAVFTEADGSFEICRKFNQPLWIRNSIYWMDHDSEGKCYCKFFKKAKL